jgi:hypothetical protein
MLDKKQLGVRTKHIPVLLDPVDVDLMSEPEPEPPPPPPAKVYHTCPSCGARGTLRETRKGRWLISSCTCHAPGEGWKV